MLREWRRIILALVWLVQVLRWGLDGIGSGAAPPGQEMLFQDVACLHREPLVVGGVGVGQDRSDFWRHGVQKDGSFPGFWVIASQAPHVEQELHGFPVPQGPLPG